MGCKNLTVVASCKHMGVTLCTDRASQKQAVSGRIGAARNIVYAARGLGSSNVLVPPSVLSKIYWSVAVPKLIYGLEITPIEETDMINMEARSSASQIRKSNTVAASEYTKRHTFSNYWVVNS